MPLPLVIATPIVPSSDTTMQQRPGIASDDILARGAAQRAPRQMGPRVPIAAKRSPPGATEAWHIHLEATPGVDAVAAIRTLLKTAQRTYGLRCVRIERETRRENQ